MKVYSENNSRNIVKKHLLNEEALNHITGGEKLTGKVYVRFLCEENGGVSRWYGAFDSREEALESISSIRACLPGKYKIEYMYQ